MPTLSTQKKSWRIIVHERNKKYVFYLLTSQTTTAIVHCIIDSLVLCRDWQIIIDSSFAHRELTMMMMMMMMKTRLQSLCA